MHTVSLTLLEKLVAGGCFNPECKADGDYSCSTAILLMLTPDAQLKEIESMGIGLVVHWHRVPLAPISSVAKLISYIHDIQKFEIASSSPQVMMYCIIIGNYSGHLAYTIELSFCVAYPLEFIDKKDPAAMTFRNPDNHLVMFMGMEMIIHQLLMWDCLEHKYARANHNGCLIIPRGLQFHNCGNFQQHGTLLPGITRDLQLYTTKEVLRLRSTGVVKPSSAPSLSISTLSSLVSLAQIQPAPTTLGLPKIGPGSPKIEPDLSSKRWEDKSSSKGHKWPVSAAAGSSTSLEKSDEWDHDMDCKGHEKDKVHNKNCERSRERKQECGHPRHKSSHHEHHLRSWL